MRLELIDNLLTLACSYDDRDKAKAIGGYKWNKERKAWQYTPDALTFKQIQDAFPGITIDPEITKFFTAAQGAVESGRQFKAKPVIHSILDQLQVKSKPMGHQLIGVSFLLNQPAGMLADEMGNGKSLQAMMTAIARKQMGQVKRCLIICPATLKWTWANEIAKHTHEKCIVIDGDKKERTKQFKEYLAGDIFFLVVNYEALRIDNFKFNFDMIIADESVRLKTPKALTTKAVKKLKAIYRVALSGYPVENRVEDIWSQVDWLRPGYLGSRWNFEDRYMVKQTITMKPWRDAVTGAEKKREFKQVLGYKNLKELHDLLYPIYMRRMKSEVLDLPPKVYQTREIELGDDQAQAYSKMKNEMRILITDMANEEFQAKARTILVQLLRLSQIADGFITDLALDRPHWFESNAKLTALDEIVDEVMASDSKMVIWSRFVPVVLKLHEKYKDTYGAVFINGSVETRERQVRVDRLQNDPNCKIFVGQIQSGGMGLTLTAASTEVFMDKAFISPSMILQAEDRLHRMGQKNSVSVITLLAKGTIDAHWEALLKKKTRLADMIFDSGQDTIQADLFTKEDALEVLE